jgi:hypothetical protein
MKTLLTFVLLLIIHTCPLNADVIRCKDGKVFNAVITQETEKNVTINLYGEDVLIPRNQIESLKRETAADNAKLESKWKKMDEEFKQESREWEKNDTQANLEIAEPTPIPTELPLPEVPEEPTQPEVISFPAEWPPSVLDQPKEITGPTSEQKRLQWIQEIQNAVHEKRVINGMNPSQVQSAWGFPDSTRKVDNVDTHTDCWTYHRAEGPVYVYFKDGTVVGTSQ